MDLHDVADIVEEHAMEAHRAFHAGHKEVTYEYFKTIMETIRECFNTMSPQEASELAKATSEKEIQDQTEKPAEVPGAVVKPTAVDPAAAAQQIGSPQGPEKPLQ